MSYFKPDYEYEQWNLPTVPEEGESKPRLLEAKHNLFQSLRDCVKEIPDASMVHFSKATNLTFRTNTNVFDSNAFLKKFSEAYSFSIKKTFPNAQTTDLEKLQNDFQEILKTVDKISKECNVENKYLFPLLLGMLSGILDYENY